MYFDQLKPRLLPIYWHIWIFQLFCTDFHSFDELINKIIVLWTQSSWFSQFLEKYKLEIWLHSHCKTKISQFHLLKRFLITNYFQPPYNCIGGGPSIIFEKMLNHIFKDDLVVKYATMLLMESANADKRWRTTQAVGSCGK
jgi:hypothetical protein